MTCHKDIPHTDKAIQTGGPTHSAQTTRPDGTTRIDETPTPTCKMLPSPGLVLSNNCIDCHMPLLPSQKIVMALSNGSQSVHNLVRTHRIAIYPESTKEYLKKIKAQ